MRGMIVATKGGNTGRSWLSVRTRIGRQCMSKVESKVEWDETSDLPRFAPTIFELGDDAVLPWRGQAELAAILDGPRCGTADGVEFDFRHADLPSAEDWHSPTGAIPFGVAFPWDRRAFDDDEVAVSAWVTGGSRGWPVLNIFAGERVSIHRVKPLYRGAGMPPFVDEHDAYELWAYLRVAHADGSVTDAEQSIMFCARDAMSPHSLHDEPAEDDDYDGFIGDFRVSYEKVVRRIERLSRAKNDKTSGEWLRFAARMRLLVDEDREGIEAEVQGLPAWDLLRLVDTATATGYALAKAEELGRLAPLAKRGMKAAASLEAATMGARRRADPLRALALEVIRANPKISQTACAREIVARTGKDQRAVERLIGPFFEWRSLPTGLREKRPTQAALKTARSSGGQPG
jgi:hypothetical protein